MSTQGHPREGLPRRVLVAVEADSLSDEAIRTALELQAAFGARLELVHALWNSTLGAEFVEAPRDIARGTDLLAAVERIVLTHVREVLRECGSDLRAEDVLCVVQGTPGRVILDRARETDSDLVVLGGLRKRTMLDFGSTARAILAKSACPVLVQPVTTRKIREILVAIDLSKESLNALSIACNWARALGARVHALSCFDTASTLSDPMWAGIAIAGAIDRLVEESRESFEGAMRDFDWGGVEHETTFVEGMPIERILAQAESADLIAMGTHGRTGLASALLGSVAYAVTKHATRPVLVVRDPTRAFQV